jgi:metal-responsive CopG/Arc/MetJ family transcriptional regulator
MMKTAISIPDDVFRLADAEATRMGVSRSELYVRALRAYLDRIEESSITERLDAIYADVDESPDLFLQRAAFLTLARAEIGE